VPLKGAQKFAKRDLLIKFVDIAQLSLDLF